MTRLEKLIQDIDSDKMACLIEGGAIPCAFCVGIGLPEICERENLSCKDGIKIWLDTEGNINE